MVRKNIKADSSNDKMAASAIGFIFISRVIRLNIVYRLLFVLANPSLLAPRRSLPSSFAKALADDGGDCGEAVVRGGDYREESVI